MKIREAPLRAARLTVRAPVRYRVSPSADWAEGWTENISKSGVLFSPAAIGLPTGEFEFVIELSRGAFQGPGVALLPDLHCHGRIVRDVVGADGATLVAASIDRQVASATPRGSARPS